MEVFMFGGIILSILGIIFIFIGIFLRKSYKNKLKNCTYETYGIVKEYVEHEDSEGSVAYYPVFKYKIGALEFEKQSNVGGNKNRYTIGEQIKIFYNPDNYEDIYEESDKLVKTIGNIFILVGTGIIFITILIGVIVWYFYNMV